MSDWRDKRAGKAGVGPFYIDATLKAEWIEFASKYGTLRDVIVAAMARHMKNPPPLPEQVALPPVPKRKPGRPKKKVENNS